MEGIRKSLEFPNTPPRTKNAKRLEQKIFGQVENRGADLVVHRMAARVGRAAQRDDQDLEPAALERGDLLRDERLGEARIPLEDEGDLQISGCAKRRARPRPRRARSRGQ